MKRPNVFLKSTLRQPVKTAALLAVTVLLVFAFVSRSSEYLLIAGETERLSGFYQANGSLVDPGVAQTQYEFEQEKGRDASEAVRYLEESPYVKMVDVRRSVSAVLPVPTSSAPDSIVGFESDHEYVEDVLFYGTLQDISKSSNNTGHLSGDYSFTFSVDEVLVGIDSMIQEQKPVILTNPRDYQVWSGEHIGEAGEIIEHLDYVDLTDLAGTLEKGERYLLRGSLALGKPGVVGVSGEAVPALYFKPLLADGPWYVPVAEGETADFDDPRLAGLREEMKIYDDNQHAMTIIAATDMSVMASTWESAQPYLVEGRWFTAEDTAAGRPVCVLPAGFDRMLGVSVGETLTLRLRDISIPYPSVTTSYASMMGYLYQEKDLARLDEIEATSVTIDLEVVGTFSFAGDVSMYMARIFLPTTLIPETFTHCQETPEASQVTFALTGPEVQTAFLAESREALAKLGFQVSMPETGWENFQAAARPMKQSSLYNALVFAAVMAAGLAIVSVVYFYMRRRKLPIVRAMGVPAKACVRQIVAPVLLLAGVPGAAIGAGLGWWWTVRNAGETLSAFAGFEGAETAAPALSALWLVLLGGAAFLLLAGMVLLGAVLLARRPVLELLQGAAAAVAKTKAGAVPAEAYNTVSTSAVSPVVQTAVPVRLAAERKRKLGLRGGLVARFVWRQVFRARLRSALTILLAAGFTIGLAAIQVAIVGSQERVDWLYENTAVEAELVPTGSYRGASIRRSTVQSLQDSGCITDFYLEAAVSAGTGVIPGLEDWDGGGLHIDRNEMVNCGLLAFEDERMFLSKAGSGANVTITYHDGWNGALFAGTYSAETEEPFPVIVPKAFYDEYEMGPGRSIVIFSRSVRPFEVAGYYEGFVSGADANSLLMPLTACQTACGGRLTYSKAHVTLDPSLNRQLDQFEEVVRDIASVQDVATLWTVIWDEELRQAVAPLEGSIVLMRVLYPVTLVLSILAAAGVSVLFIMTSAKEAAILRIQGTTKLRTQVMMGLQQTLTCFVGLIVGLVSVLLYVGSARPAMLAGIAASSGLCALAYLTAATVGAVFSSAVVTSKNPLELLQVKE